MPSNSKHTNKKLYLIESTPPGEGDQSILPVASLLCEPSHSGIVAVRLQVQKKTFRVSGAVNCIGENPEP